MRSRGWHSYAIAATLVFIQVGVSALGTIGMCVDRPHTHGGVPAPDCRMHNSQPMATAPESAHPSHHHQHDDSAPADGARLVCSCSADPLTLLTTEIAVVPAISIGLSNLTPLLSSERTPSVPDVRLTPLSPPPRFPLS
jgi:hypothetical protein